MARVELSHHPLFGDLLTGPAPTIRGSHFPPGQKMRLEATCQDSNGCRWSSRGCYRVSEMGVFDTSLETGKDENMSEFLFTSMTCQYGAGRDFPLKSLSRVDYTVSCFEEAGGEIWERRFSRYVGRDERGLPEPWANVILFDDEIQSDRLVTTLALAPYGIGVVGHLVGCSVDHREAPSRLQRELPTYIMGSGRASTRALEYAIGKPDILGVILFSGAGMRFEPTAQMGPNTSGERQAYVAIDASRLLGCREHLLSTHELYSQALAGQRIREQVAVEVENVLCPITMFSGQDDQVWPSSLFGEWVAERRRERHCPYPTILRTFKGAGHDLGPSLGLPTLPTTERTIGHPDTEHRFSLGGQAETQGQARRECWNEMLQILAGGPSDTL